MPRHRITIRGSVRSRVHVTRRVRPVVTYVEPVAYLTDARPSLTEIATEECPEHHRQATITANAAGTLVEACCDAFRVRIEKLLAA